MNQYESQAIRELLAASGFEEAPSKDDADICIVNTCTVTAEADRESKQVIGALGKKNPSVAIVATGCLVEREAAFVALFPNVSHIVRNADKGSIADILKRIQPLPQPRELRVSDFKSRSRAYLKIQDGCRNRCSYCKVCLVRSDLRSKPIPSILDEISILVDNGFKEIVLTGICLGAWGIDLYDKEGFEGPDTNKASLVSVLKAIDKLPGDFRLRLSSIEPKYVTDELIDFIAQNRRICRHLHVPLQSGDDDILRKMNRPYSSSEYMEIINKIKGVIKDIAITTDVIVGFPQETDAMFRNTLEFVRALQPSRTHIFTFSPRDGTAAFKMAGHVSESVMKKRYDELSVIATESAKAYRKKFIGRELEILVETKRDALTGLLNGYSDNYIKVFFEGPNDIMKKIVSVKITAVNEIRTEGEYVR
ncbi:MAG: tRNA (N(6)-L-threonylcarbamoyladenosine(37)-C(2))-methylthiotransferase MtaB [Candidatus Omnitrophica bacterium]|nr:tRNA (N(6)-L-threonylcarbamoyladenosine(37)-C(2))-methylthiotransferase MtaB [Candidatus Omnitrophota bacterium]